MEQTLDLKILSLMESDVNAGTAAALEAYGGLVWSACARRLRDPEDIRECVNDTFLAFSAGFRRFEPEKGSLGNYLCIIALRRATERYRKNLSVSRAEEKYRSVMEQSSHRDGEGEDLAAALEQLDPVDARILREKYYQGMTYQEIAASLGLPYETVKKRGQRNLKKLRFILIGLILALLAAGCAYMIYRSFQFAEGAGPNFDPDRPIYQLSAVEGEPYELDAGTFFVENAIYQDGQLYVKIGVMSGEDWTETEDGKALFEKRNRFSTFCAMLLDAELRDGADHQPIAEAGQYPETHSTDGAGKGAIEKTIQWMPEDTGDALTVEVTLWGDNLDRERLETGYVATGIITGRDMEKLLEALPAWTLTLEKVDFTDSDQSEGTFHDYLDTGFMVRGGVAYAGGAYVSLYPYQTETAYTLSAMLLHNFGGTYDDRCITLTAEDGTVYPADTIRGASASPLMEREISFPDAPAGEYILTIPYLCVSTVDTTGSVTVPVPTADGETMALDETLTFSDGSSVHLTGITYVRRTVDGFITGPDNQEIPQELTEWDYVMTCELQSGEELLLTGVFGGGTLALADGAEEIAPWGASVGPDQPELRLTLSQAALNHETYQEGASYDLTICFSNPTYILDQQIEIPLTVHEFQWPAGEN